MEVFEDGARLSLQVVKNRKAYKKLTIRVCYKDIQALEMERHGNQEKSGD